VKNKGLLHSISDEQSVWLTDPLARVSLSAHVEFIGSVSRVKVLKQIGYFIFHFAGVQVRKLARTLTEYGHGIRPEIEFSA
jgi:hypothetical protein